MKTIFGFLAMTFLVSSCAYNEVHNNYTANGDNNRFDTSQTSSTSKPVDVQTDMAGSGYGAVQK